MKIDTVINIRDEVIDLYERTKDKYSFTCLEEMIAYAVGVGIQQIESGLAGESLLNKVMTPPEASQRWGLKRDTVRAALTRGRFDEQIARGLVRKAEKTWLITEQAMREVYGEPKRG